MKTFLIYLRHGDEIGREPLADRDPAACDLAAAVQGADDWRVSDPAISHAHLLRHQQRAITAARDRRLARAVAYLDGLAYDADPASRANLGGLLTAASAGVPVPWPQPWRDAGNVVRQLSHAQACALAAAMLGAVAALYAASWHLKDSVLPGLSLDALAALDLDADALWQVP